MMGTRVSEERIRTLFETIGAHGRRENGGCERLAFSPAERAARGALADAAFRLGFHVFRDAVGSVFALRPGTDPEAQAVYTGSHLDTVPAGGCFDGASGVLCGLAAPELLETEQVSTRRPIVLVSWANEEGARFAPAMMGSGVFTGAIPFETAAASTDAGGVTVGEELAREKDIPRGNAKAQEQPGNAEAAGDPGISDNAEAAGDPGVTDDTEASTPATAGHIAHPGGLPRPAAYLELHPEQGRILEAEGVQIGIVEGVQGQAAGDWTMAGRADHAGSTPMDDRADALVAAARLVA
ncbi:MAG: M20/M25/M40 family metallo-hydrolase, partial [Spirochaetes bacterium]|nr:M20/M25/M40 family metallo-hydrolase [Spirochaetota bacterium]